MATTPHAGEYPYLTMYSAAPATANAVKFWALLLGAGASAPTVEFAGGIVASVSRTAVGEYRVTLALRPSPGTSGQPLCFPVVQFLDGGGTAPIGWTAVVTKPATTTLAGLTATRFFVNTYDDTDAAADLPVDVYLQLETTLVVGNA